LAGRLQWLDARPAGLLSRNGSLGEVRLADLYSWMSTPGT
jgi:hypothetical protein